MTTVAGNSIQTAAAENKCAALPNDGRRWLLILLLCPLFVIGCWSAPFAPLDDGTLIQGNPVLQREASWFKILEGEKLEYFYMPVLDFSFRVDRTIYEPLLGHWLGENAWAAGIRINSVLYHAFAAWMVWLILRRLKASNDLSAFVLIVFALHPIACHSICWAIERKTILSGALGFSAVALYMRGRTRLAPVFYALALLAKAAALGLVTIIFLWELLGRPEVSAAAAPPLLQSLRTQWRAIALRLLPWVAISGVNLWISMHLVTDMTLPPIGGSLWTVCLIDVLVLWKYAWNLLWPAHLSYDYAITPVLSIKDGRLWLYGALLLVLVAATILLTEKYSRRLAIFGWLWFVGALAPALNLVGKNNLVVDCYIYYSMPGLWLAVGLALSGAATRLRRSGLRIPAVAAPAFLLILTALLCTLTANRSGLYANWRLLLEDSVRNEPGSSLNHLVLAQQYGTAAKHEYQLGDQAKAEEFLSKEQTEYETGIAAVNFERTLMMPFAFERLGQIYLYRGRDDEAFNLFSKELELPLTDDKAGTAMEAVGGLYLKRNDPLRALVYFNHALERCPQRKYLHLEQVRALLALNKQLQASNDTANARECLEKARQMLTRFPWDDKELYARAQQMLSSLPPQN